MTEERNPSPPREFDDRAETFRQDLIGNTTISKKWVYKILVEVCTVVDSHQKVEEKDVVDISEDLQDDMCRLWDLCIEEDVANFLVDSDSIDTICKILNASKSPRLTEIITGILGNMTCAEKACKALSQSPEALLSIISLFSCRDSLTLGELGRLVTTCLSTQSCQGCWLDFLESNVSNFYDDVTFILSSCTNESVLKYTLEVIDICLDSRDSMLMSFSRREFSDIVAKAGLQLLQSGDWSAGAITHLHILYLITAAEDSVSDIFACNRNIFQFVAKCFEIWSGLDEFSIADDNPSAIPLASCMTIYYTILDASQSSENFGQSFFETISDMQKQSVSSLTNSTIKYCDSISCSKGVSKSEQQSAGRETCATEKVPAVKGLEVNEGLVNGVPILDIANDLKNIITKLKWTQ